MFKVFSQLGKYKLKLRWDLSHPVRTNIATKTNKDKCYQGFTENRILLLVTMQISTDAGNQRSSKKLKIEMPYDPAVPLLDIHLKNFKPTYHEDTCTSMFVAL